MGCDNCRPQCPTGAISVDTDDGQLWINPAICNNCEGFFPEPQCVVLCPTSLPMPYQAKKGRTKADVRPLTSPDLFANGKNNPFASAIVVWEACNILAQRQSLPWQIGEDDKLTYQRSLSQGRGQITLRMVDTLDLNPPIGLAGTKAISAIEALDIRATCLHLIYAAYATTLDKPWEQEFVISDRQIEEYLGLDKRKDLTKLTKLSLIKEIAQQPCFIKTQIDWPQQGRIPGFTIPRSRLWHMLEIQHHFQDDEEGCKHLSGLTFTIRPGLWTKYFLNKQGCKETSAFYQYASLPKSLLTTVMSIWQQHEGAARMMLWLLFKVRLGKDQRITVPTLMRVAYGEAKVTQASVQRDERKRLIKAFENDLAALNYYGLKPNFDPETYPLEIQPLWSKLADLPDDAEEALEFWLNDGSSGNRLTDPAPRGKWNMLMNARILSFGLPPDWDVPVLRSQKKQHNPAKRKKVIQLRPQLSSEQIVTARQEKGWSQRELAAQTGKSQSWIRDIENGRFQAKSTDQDLLRKILELS
jgi:DNA-binding transcriptional regulator YiaG